MVTFLEGTGDNTMVLYIIREMITPIGFTITIRFLILFICSTGVKEGCGWTATTTSFLQIRRNHGSGRWWWLHYQYLTSAMEEGYPIPTPIPLSSLSGRDQRNRTSKFIQWMDLQDATTTPEHDSNYLVRNNKESIHGGATKVHCRMPLYPLPSVTIPDVTNENVTFWNVERRNIQMVLDLEQPPPPTAVAGRCCDPRPLLCVVLQAKDTGRIASVGTVVRIVHLDKELKYDRRTTTTTTRSSDDDDDDDGGIPPQDLFHPTSTSSDDYRRIVVTCVPVGIATNITVVNPQASTREHRLRYPNDYLSAMIEYQDLSSSSSSMSEVCDDSDELSKMKSISRQIRNDLNAVLTMYRSNPIVTRNWPPIMISRIQSMSNFDDFESLIRNPNDDDDDSGVLTTTEFWSVVQLWQTLCETIRMVYETTLTAERNEYMVNAAIQNGNGGPLQLPIHLEDLIPTDRRHVEQMERTAQQDWQQLQLEPCIDFQILLSLRHDHDRFDYLSQMIAQERQRLENDMVQDSDRACTEERSDPSVERPDTPPVRRGAWFNDDYW